MTLFIPFIYGYYTYDNNAQDTFRLRALAATSVLLATKSPALDPNQAAKVTPMLQATQSWNDNR